ncbi:MAG: alpha/beta hydrolase [Holophagales bacterium]|jgi:pimeloyl-ACP methyl ester carboxylesterase|nr:alpha/beta hydrolase [Holophagales bacterium]
MYLKVNGIELFYEKCGSGNPIILLHGNGEDHTIFDVLTSQLSRHCTVYAIDSRGHGKSSSVKHFDYRSMMEDVAAFIKELSIDNVMLYGFSDGGIIGLLLAIEHPNMISKLIVSGANTLPSGIKTINAILMQVSYLFTRDQKLKLMLTQPNITNVELDTISTPTLVLAGSKDVVREEHTRMIAANIKNCTLKILEGESHSSYVVHSDKLYGIIAPFLATDDH